MALSDRDAMVKRSDIVEPKPMDTAKAIRLMRYGIAASAIVIALCAVAACMVRSVLPLSGITSNVIAIVIGRYAIKHLRRKQSENQRNTSGPGI